MTKPPAGPPPPDDEPDDAGDRTDPHGAGDGHSDEARSELFSNGFPTFGLSRNMKLASDEFLGRVIDSHEIVKLIGEGGMSLVFEAKTKQPSRSVAFKIGKPGPFLAERLAQDAECLKDLKHPGIARVLAGGELDSSHGQLPYMVTELVPDARHLTDYCWQELPKLQDRVALFIQVCLAVHECHSRRPSLVHLDLKPGNILVGRDGRPKVIDFGIARVVTDSSGNTTTVMITGTPEYMSPEQRRGEVAAPPSDVYSLGLILKKALPTTATPEPSPSPHHESDCRSSSQPLPSRLKRIIDRCLHDDAALRYPDAGSLAQALRHWLHWQVLDALDWQQATWPRATGRWLHARRRKLAGGSLAAAVAAALAWAVFIRPDMPAFARAMAAASAASTPATEAAGTRAIAEAERIWRLARPFARSQPLELACLASRNARDGASRLVAAAAQTMAVSGGARPLAAVGYPGGVALLDPTNSDRRLICRLGSSAPISTVTFSADGSRLFAGDEAGRVLVWDTARLLGKPIDSTPRRVDLKASAAATVLAIDVPSASTATARWCLALDANGRIFRVDAAGNQTGPEASLLVTIPDARDIALLDSGRLLAIATDSGQVEFRDLRQPSAVLRTETVGPAPIDLARNRDGRSLYAASPRQLALWSNPRSAAAAKASLPAAWEETTPRVVTATADACLIARQTDGGASLHCFRDVRGRLNPMPRWQETLTLRSTAPITAAAVVPGKLPALAVLDARGFLTTGR